MLWACAWSRLTSPHRLQEYLINTRNTLVTNGLIRLYGSLPGANDDIPIFCVSNTLYWSVRDQAAHRALPTLELSGILAMRRHFLSIVASSQLRAARTYINDEVPNILSQIDLWVQSGARQGSEERRAVIRQTILEVEEILTRVRKSPPIKKQRMIE